ncbi:hypothetical protein GW17_00053042 [Ensete ventricosum]|nr:hypothetical protein GW17_00053042 [Ensete ventricosum]
MAVIQAPPRADVVKSLKNGVGLNLLGIGAAILGMQATVGLLFAKVLTTSALPYYQGISPGQNPVLPLDVFLVQVIFKHESNAGMQQSKRVGEKPRHQTKAGRVASSVTQHDQFLRKALELFHVVGGPRFTLLGRRRQVVRCLLLLVLRQPRVAGAAAPGGGVTGLRSSSLGGGPSNGAGLRGGRPRQKHAGEGGENYPCTERSHGGCSMVKRLGRQREKGRSLKGGGERGLGGYDEPTLSSHGGDPL